MQALRPDRVVRGLTALVSAAYLGTWIVGILVLTALPAAKLFGGAASNLVYGLELPVAAPDVETRVQTAWGPAPLKLAAARGKLELPIPMLPWSLVAVLWSYTAVAVALLLLFLRNLRRIFQRVRDGAAFDAQNALRLRTLSVLLFALAMLDALAEVATSVAVRSGLARDADLAVARGLHVDLTLVWIALVLVVLAEVFRRGTQLEDEQSLVI
jgi:Protein of unknown function (DUF2975)